MTIGSGSLGTASNQSAAATMPEMHQLLEQLYRIEKRVGHINDELHEFLYRWGGPSPEENVAPSPRCGSEASVRSRLMDGTSAIEDTLFMIEKLLPRLAAIA